MTHSALSHSSIYTHTHTNSHSLAAQTHTHRAQDTATSVERWIRIRKVRKVLNWLRHLARARAILFLLTFNVSICLCVSLHLSRWHRELKRFGKGEISLRQLKLQHTISDNVICITWHHQISNSTHWPDRLLFSLCFTLSRCHRCS